MISGGESQKICQNTFKTNTTKRTNCHTGRPINMYIEYYHTEKVKCQVSTKLERFYHQNLYDERTFLFCELIWRLVYKNYLMNTFAILF